MTILACSDFLFSEFYGSLERALKIPMISAKRIKEKEVDANRAFAQIAERTQLRNVADYLRLRNERFAARQVARQYARLLEVHRSKVFLRHAHLL